MRGEDDPRNEKSDTGRLKPRETAGKLRLSLILTLVTLIGEEWQK